MKAIQVNPETFPKIEHLFPPNIVDVIRSRYDAIRDHEYEEMYLWTGVSDVSSFLAWATISTESLFSNFILETGKGDWSNYPNDWFEVRLRKENNA